MIKHFCDAGAAGAACLGLASIIGYVPTILGVLASLISIAWYAYRFYKEFASSKGTQA